MGSWLWIVALIACDPAPDEGEDTGGQGEDTGTDEELTGWSWEETFDDGEALDPDGTEAELADGRIGGFGAAPRPELGPFGGTDAFALPDTGELAAGTHAFTSFTLPAASELLADGDLVLRVDGDFVMEPGSTLDVRGDLVVEAGGRIDVDCAWVEARGDLVLRSAGDVRVGCTTGDRSFVTAAEWTGAADPSSLRIDALGAITVGPESFVELSAASNGLATSGSLRLHSVGDVTVTTRSFVMGDQHEGAVQPLRIWTLGALSVLGDSYVLGLEGTDAPSGDIDLRTMDGVTLVDSFVIADPGGGVRLRTRGAVSLDASQIIAGDSIGADPAGDVDVLAQSAWLHDFSFFIPGDGESAPAGDAIGRFAGDLQLDLDSFILGGNGECADAGAVDLDVGGDLLLTLDSYLYGGEPRVVGGCDAPAPGAVTVDVAGTVTQEGALPPWISTWDHEGVEHPVEPNEGAPVSVTPDAELSSTWRARTLPQDALIGPVTAVDVEVEGEVEARLSPDGTEEGAVPLDEAVGLQLSDGWWVDLSGSSGLFAPSLVDRVALEGVPE